jgi:tRNA G10  N-methylase Trm11
MGNYDTGATTLGNFGRRVERTIQHPAKYSRSVTHAITRLLTKLAVTHPEKSDWAVLDPFGGVGGIFDIHVIEGDFDAGELTYTITCIEIEQEWANDALLHARYRPAHDQVLAMDFFDFAIHPAMHEAFDLVVVSPTYGNRMADHHEAKDDSVRNTYRHKLGRPLSENSSAAMQWGDDYRDFHRAAWDEVFDLIEPGGYFILNVKDHIRKGAKQPVSAWHKAYVGSIGFNLIEQINVGVRGNRQGENGDVRVDDEQVYLFQKPWSVSVDNIGEAHYAEQSILKGVRDE